MLAIVSHIAIGATDLVAAFLFLFGLKRMSSPATAASGIRVAGVGMIAAVLVSFLYVFTIDAASRPHLPVNLALAVVALVIGGGFAWFVGRKVAMTAMPQMVAIYNGMGGGAAGGIAAVELFGNRAVGTTQLVVTLLGALIGAVSMSGSVIAWAKLQGVLGNPLRFGGQRVLNGVVFVAALAVGGWIVFTALSGVALVLPIATWIMIFFGLALLFGILMTLPIGGADMPVVISIYNAFTGLAVGWAAAIAIAMHAFWLGAALILVSRLLDGLDGAVARATTPTDRGGFLDITLDFLFYASIPLAFAVARPDANALAAAVLLAAGTKGKRLALEHARILIHQPSGGGEGQSSDIEIQAREILRMRDLLEQMLADHSGQDVAKVRKDIERDKILTAREAVEYGLIDEVVSTRKTAALSAAGR